jgi:hypothetical protein
MRCTTCCSTLLSKEKNFILQSRCGMVALKCHLILPGQHLECLKPMRAINLKGGWPSGRTPLNAKSPTMQMHLILIHSLAGSANVGERERSHTKLKCACKVAALIREREHKRSRIHARAALIKYTRSRRGD